MCEDALRLGRILAGRMAEEAEVHGLVALMELQASRLKARTRPNGETVLLLDQNRAQGGRMLIGRGLAAPARAEKAGPRGPYNIQAHLDARHARAHTTEEPAQATLARPLAATATEQATAT